MEDTTEDTTQQATSKIPVTGAKNPKRVAAGKAIAEKRRQAREEQKKKLAEADSIMANERLRKAQEEARKAEVEAQLPVEVGLSRSCSATFEQLFGFGATFSPSSNFSDFEHFFPF